MKNILHFSPLMLVFIGLTTNANATAYIYSNSITAHNIATIQHKIAQSVFNTTLYKNPTKLSRAHAIQPVENPHKTYGRAPEYGTASTYGEYNVFGRNGGDNTSPALSNIWIDWQNINDDVKFDNSTPIDTNINMITAGVMGDTYISDKTTHTWGLYSGYIHSTQNIPDFEIQSDGGYFGIYNGTSIGNFAIKFMLNGGLLDNSSDAPLIHESYTNFWLGGAANISYAIQIDPSFTLRPALHAAYTWIQSDDYENITNDDFNMYEISPAVDMIKHIGSGWYGTIGLKYVMINSSGGAITFGTQDISELDMGAYYEYGLSLSKTLYRTNFVAHIGRHDGARYGWFGGIKINHTF